LETQLSSLGSTIKGAQIYQADGDGIASSGMIGFAAIGIGARHAESQFMLGEHTRFDPFHEAILLTYIAKKRSEVAPGVGTQTDMFFIGAGGYRNLTNDQVDALDSIYNDVKDAQDKAVLRGKTAVQKYIEELLRKEEERRKAEEAEKQRPAPSRKKKR
jgi:hypothetical protein